MSVHVRRREFITLLGGAALEWPLAAWAQQGERTKRVGVLMGYPEGDRQAQANVTALRQSLENLGWIEGRNVQIDYRWAGADPAKARAFAKELIALAPDVIVPSTNQVTRIVQQFEQALEHLGWAIGRNIQIDYIWGEGDNEWVRAAAAELLRRAPDVILANGSSAVRPMQQATRTVPIIFIGGADPVGDGFVKSLAHPGGNLTGFTVLEESIGAKLLDVLKEIAPRAAHISVMINPDSPSHLRLFNSAAA